MNIGRPLPRREDASLIVGAGAFVDDLRPGAVTYARFVRSPMAHARILRIDTSAARRADGVVAVLTAGDLNLPPLEAPLDNPGARPLPRPMLARDVARFAGEAVALVIAESRHQAEDAAERLVIDFEELPVIACVDDALAEGAPRLHEHATNVLYEASFAAGDVDAAFAAADVVIERTFVSPRQSALPLETRGVLAEPTEAGLYVHASTQVPHLFRRAVAQALGLPLDDVR